jgi:hypothetical protein
MIFMGFRNIAVWDFTRSREHRTNKDTEKESVVLSLLPFAEGNILEIFINHMQKSLTRTFKTCPSETLFTLQIKT